MKEKKMNLNDDQIHSRNQSWSPETDDSNPEFDDSDEDSIQEIQHILQIFGRTDCSTSSLDYYDTRRYEIMYEMMNLEKQFDQLKNIFYDQSILFLDTKLIAIENEEAPEYQHELAKLYDEMKLRLDIAKQRHEIELEALENSTQSELLSLEQTLENDKFLLYYHMKENIQNQIDEIETLKMKSELCANILQEFYPLEYQQQTITVNKKRTDSYDSIKPINRKKRRTIEKDNLAIFYQLSDINVTEDWAIIQTSLQQSSSIISSNNNSDKSDSDDDTNQLVIMTNLDTFQDKLNDSDEN
ncbi:hypothetical protein I4U23_006682 [Adineta vaga]|nr:hypothetical protein I4U23_006682 [Adineta vaga]